MFDLVLKEGIAYEEVNEIKKRSSLEDVLINLREDLLFFEGNE